ncbi:MULTISPECIES: hypothetical protein [unclassified Corallococcus]|uniref:hypothetical protein n=1 Tax=unclassified Corallococcus TaxID=2685029 RepID=UPI001A8CAD22|nr:MULTISPECIES: hypothetical protein [unclassified Corallococcus]MBN9687150.1 hypothetical protein [Corallococcus sp. NCSPR001]WAS89023.1 hypothetical protein O0N60_19070 [Corallococcus sp. NCRR]
MARIRCIKPDFFMDEDLAALSPLARLLFIGLWTLADRDGRLEDRPARLKASVFPYHEADVQGLLTELERGHFIQRYEADGKHCIAVRNFKKHQRPHPKETSFGLPPPPEPGTNTASRERPRQGVDASRRVPVVVGNGDGDGCGNGDGFPAPPEGLPLTVRSEDGYTPPPSAQPEEGGESQQELLPHEPPPSTEPPLGDLLDADFQALRGAEYRRDRADPAAMRELLAKGAPAEIRRRWRIGIAVTGYGRCSKWGDLVRFWNDHATAPPERSGSPPGKPPARSLNRDDYREGPVETL